jgi:hypothetical protein
MQGGDFASIVFKGKKVFYKQVFYQMTNSTFRSSYTRKQDPGLVEFPPKSLAYYTGQSLSQCQLCT